MKRILVVVAALAMVFALQTSANAWFINFEDGADGAPVVGIPGIAFNDFNGFNPLYGDSSTGNYNTTSDDLGYSHFSGNYHHRGDFFVWAGPEANAQGLKVDFTNNDGSFFTTGYSSYSEFFVTAYLTDGTNISISGAANLNNPMGFLTINATAGTSIDYVVLHDTGNFWLVDDMSGDASGIPGAPEPSTLLLLGSGLIGMAAAGKRFRK